jgi:hypothetical protein
MPRGSGARALHEAGHALISVGLGATNVSATIDGGVDHGGHSRYVTTPSWWGVKESLAVVLAGPGAVAADQGVPLLVSQIESIVELEQRDDLRRGCERNPRLAEQGLELWQRLVWAVLDDIRGLADVLEQRAGELVRVTRKRRR